MAPARREAHGEGRPTARGNALNPQRETPCPSENCKGQEKKPRRGETHGEGRPTARGGPRRGGNAHGEGRPRQEGRPTARGGPGEGMPSILREKPPARRKIARDKRKSPAGEPALCGGRPPSREFPPAGGGPRRGEAHGKGRPRRGGPSIKREKPPARRKIARNGRKMPPGRGAGPLREGRPPAREWPPAGQKRPWEKGLPRGRGGRFPASPAGSTAHRI